MVMSTVDILKQLVDTPSPSGFEKDAQSIVSRIITPYVDEVSEDIQGNLICKRFANSANGSKNIMLMAHIDEVGMMVTYIEPSGYVRFNKIGGVDPQIIQGQCVNIIHEGNSVKGVIGALPVHMKNKDIQKNALDFSEMWIDIGATSREDALNRIQIGDPIITDSTTNILSGNVVSSRACDDKSGVTALLRTAELLKGKNIPNHVVFVTSIQEEVGTRGAMVAAYNIQPNVCIAIDVTHATDYPNVQKSKYGEICLEAGVAIPVGSDLSISVQHNLIELAISKDIPFQRFALPGPSGTDAHAVQVSRGGCMAGLLSIPCRYMHTPVECVSIMDVEYTAELLAEFCEKW